LPWIRNSVAAALLAASATTAIADTLVVRSTGPSAKSYPAGKSIADSASITLQAGDQLTLLDGRGTRVLRGPGSFSPGGTAAAGGAGDSRFAALVGSGGSDRRVRIGAVRGVGATAHAPNLWYVDTGLSGPVCIADPSAVTLWRHRSDIDQTLVVTGARGKSAKLTWPRDSATVTWPATIPVTAGENYMVSVDGGTPESIRFVTLGMVPSGLEQTTSALIRSGCQHQLDTLVDTLAVPPAGG
jgi:hypothetical protein